MFDPARVWAYRAATVPRLAHAVEPVEQSRPAPIPPAWVHPLSDFKSKRAELPARVRVGAPQTATPFNPSTRFCPRARGCTISMEGPQALRRLLPACAWVHLLIPHRVRNWTKRGFRQIFIHAPLLRFETRP